VIGVSLDEAGWDAVGAYVAKQSINYPIVLGNESVIESYRGLESLPTTLIIDRHGRVAATHVGLVSKSVYERDILSVLAATR
jgi:cytochrome c biogenesis protein CcmG/thiol:disulfide interchange protein DsbE